MSAPGPSHYTEKDLQYDLLYRYLSVNNPEFTRRLPYAFQRLRSLDVSEGFLTEWIRRTFLVLVKDFNSFPYRPDEEFDLVKRFYDRFVDELLNAGVIGAMLDVSVLHAHRKTEASYMAIDIIYHLCLAAGSDEKKIICKELVARDAFGLLVKDLTSSSKFAQRAAAGCCLERILSQTYLVEELSITQIVDLALATTSYNLRDYVHIVQDLAKPETSYMKAAVRYEEGMMLGAYGETRDLAKTIQIAPVWFGNAQVNTLLALEYVLFRRNRLTRRDCLAIIKQKPEILDNLLLIASQERPALYPEQPSDAVAALSLYFLVMQQPFSYDNFNSYENHQKPSERESGILCTEILFKRANSLQLLAKLRIKPTSDDPWASASIISKQWNERGNVEMARGSLDKQAKMMGTLRICALAIFGHFTLLKDVPPPVLLALLPIAYEACSRVPDEDECNAAKQKGKGVHFTMGSLRDQRHIHEVTLGPTWRDSEDVTVLHEPQIYIGPETIMGPTLLFQILDRLATSGYPIDELRRLKRMPLNTPILSTFPTPLIHIHQIVEPRVIGKLIRMTVHRRIPMRRDLGTRGLMNNIAPDHARIAYISAAHLAQTVADFGTRSPNVASRVVRENVDSIRRACQEVVLCLGNACEAAVKMKDWALAKFYAQTAIDRCNDIRAEDATAISWDLESSRQKNLRRLERVTQTLELQAAR